MTDLLGNQINRYPLITARLAAANSAAFVISTEAGYTSVTITAHGLSAGESIPIQIQAEDDSWGDASTVGGVDVEVTYSANTITLSGVGKYRVAKGVTTLPTSVTLYR